MTGAQVERKPGRVLEWIWCGQALKKASGYFSELPRVEQARLQRAELALELADRAYDPIEPLRAGPSLSLSISLYREAAYWALLAQSEAYEGRELRALFETLPQELLEFAAGGTEALSDVKQALVERSFVDTAALPSDSVLRDARVSREFSQALLRRKLQPQAAVGRLLLLRSVRSFGVAALLVSCVVAVWLGVARGRVRPDLAAGKPWLASSTLASCAPLQHSCAGNRTDIFFNTLEEKNPWLRIDLGRSNTFSVVEVANRRDCCPDRAIPLVVEVSSDDKTWREVARRTETFGHWRAEFAPQTARYVRVRALRRTMLHLEKVAVRAS